MNRLLIVDDEPQIADWLFDLFNGMEHMELDVYKAYSGEDALAFLNRTKMDVVLTDVYMPGIDGIKLVEWIRSTWPHCRVIFLTGYNDFKYAYKAIKFNCIDYLLKTEDDEEIIKAVKKAISDIKRELKDTELLNEAKERMNIALPLLQKQYLLDLLNSGESALKSIDDRFAGLDLPLDASKPIRLVLGHMDNADSCSGNEMKKTEILWAVKLLMEKHLSSYECKFFIDYGQSNFVYFIQTDSRNHGESRDMAVYERENVLLIGMLDTIQEASRTSLDTTLSFIFNEEDIALEHAADMFAGLRQLMELSMGVESEYIFTDRSFPEHILKKITSSDDRFKEGAVQVKKLDVLCNYLEKGQREEFFKLMAEMTECLKGIRNRNHSPALEIYFSIALKLLSYINRWRLEESIAFKITVNKLMRIEEHVSWDDAVRYITDLAGVIFDIQDESRRNITEHSILQVQSYIDGHLNEELSLVRLAELVYFNPSYLSRLFKQTTGVNLSEYIIITRVAKARKLLEETKLKIHEIASLVGAESQSYFGQMFKKSTGMSPHEYRDIYQRGK